MSNAQLSWDLSKRIVATGESISGNLETIIVSTDHTLSSSEVENTIVTNYGQAVPADTTLPSYQGRTVFKVVSEQSGVSWSFKPPAGEVQYLNGTPLDADDEIDIDTSQIGMVGTYMRVSGVTTAYEWHFLDVYGTAQDGGVS